MKRQSKISRATIAACLIATGIGFASKDVFAQSSQGQSRAAVEQELSMVATQMMANPNGYNHATMLAASARGLTLSLGFRMKADSTLSLERYAEQVTNGFCQHPAMKQYTYQHGVVLAITVDAANGNGSHRFQIDSAACAIAGGVPNSPPASQTRTVSKPVPNATIGGRSTFNFKGIVAGEPADMSLLQGCNKEQTGETQCYFRDGTVAGISEAMAPSVFLHDGKTYMMLFLFNNDGANFVTLLSALRERYGAPCRNETKVWQNRAGAKIDNAVVTWCFKTGELELVQLSSSMRYGSLTYIDKVFGPPSQGPTVDF